PQLALQLRAPRERQRRIVRAQHVQALDLVVERRLPVRVAQRLDERVDRLGAVRRSVVDRLHPRHGATLRGAPDGGAYAGVLLDQNLTNEIRRQLRQRKSQYARKIMDGTGLEPVTPSLSTGR